MELPIRGAIAAGDAILDRSTDTYLGKPILEAHELEANQDWLGLTFSYQATWPPLIADISPKLLMEYQIPVKKGETTRISLIGQECGVIITANAHRINYARLLKRSLNNLGSII